MFTNYSCYPAMLYMRQYIPPCMTPDEQNDITAFLVFFFCVTIAIFPQKSLWDTAALFQSDSLTEQVLDLWYCNKPRRVNYSPISLWQPVGILISSNSNVDDNILYEPQTIFWAVEVGFDIVQCLSGRVVAVSLLCCPWWEISAIWFKLFVVSFRNILIGSLSLTWL